MILIGICDDEQLHRSNVRELCERFFSEFPNEHDYVEFSSGEEVLAYDGERMLLLFLDIQMGEVSGLDILNALREKENVWRIAFISSYVEYRIDTIDLMTLAFLEKPLTYGGVKKCLGIAIRENKENISASFKSLNGSISVEVSDLVYMQAADHYINVHTKSFDFTSYGGIKDYEECLKGMSMIRIHKSYLVNLQYVKSVQSEKVVLTDGRRLPVGRKYNSALRERYSSYIKSVTINRDRGD